MTQSPADDTRWLEFDLSQLWTCGSVIVLYQVSLYEMSHHSRDTKCRH